MIAVGCLLAVIAGVLFVLIATFAGFLFASGVSLDQLFSL